MLKIQIQSFFQKGLSLYTDFRTLSYKTSLFVRVDPYLVLNTEIPYLVLKMGNAYFCANKTQCPFLTRFSFRDW